MLKEGEILCLYVDFVFICFGKIWYIRSKKLENIDIVFKFWIGGYYCLNKLCWW